jgi:hypothetical protein
MARELRLQLPVEVDEELRLRLMDARNVLQLRIERLRKLQVAFALWQARASINSSVAQHEYARFQSELERLTLECQSTAQTTLLDELELGIFRDILQSIDLLTQQTVSLEQLIIFGYDVLERGVIRHPGPRLTLAQQRRIAGALRRAENRRAHLQRRLNRWYANLQTFLEKEPVGE